MGTGGGAPLLEGDSACSELIGLTASANGANAAGPGSLARAESTGLGWDAGPSWAAG